MLALLLLSALLILHAPSRQQSQRIATPGSGAASGGVGDKQEAQISPSLVPTLVARSVINHTSRDPFKPWAPVDDGVGDPLRLPSVLVATLIRDHKRRCTIAQFRGGVLRVSAAAWMGENSKRHAAGTAPPAATPRALCMDVSETAAPPRALTDRGAAQ